MLSFKSLAVKKSMMLEEANSNNFNNSGCGSHGNPLSSALTSTTTNLKASSSPSQNGLLTKKKYSQGYGLALTPSQLFEQYTAGLNSSNSAQYAKQQHQMQQQSQQQQSQTAVNAPTTATINLISLQDKQVGLPVQPLAQQQQQQQSQQNEDKRSKSSGSQNKNLGKVSKTPQLTPILNSSQCEDSAPRGKSSQQQRQNGSTSQYQQIGSQLQSQQPQYQSSNLYQSSQQNNSNNHHSSSSSSSAQKKQSLKVNLYSSNQYQTSSSAAGTTATGNSAIPGSISKTNSSNIFHRKSNSTQLNKNFFDQSSQPQQQQQQQHTYLGESTASMGVNNPTQSSTVTNTGLGNGNTSLSLQQSGSNAIANNHHKMATSTLKSKIKISNYQGLVFGNNSNLQMDSTRSLNINLHLNNQNGGGSSSLTSSQYNPATTTTTYSQNLRASKNNFLNMESNSETTTPKHTVSKLYQSSLLSSNLQNNENIDYLAAPHSTKGERFPNLNMSHKPTHQRVNSDKVYKQIHQSLKNQSNQKSNKQSENTLGMSGQFQDANESSLMDNRTKDLQNQLKSSLMQQYQLQQQQQNQQKQSSGFTQNQSNQQMSYSGQNLQHQLAQQQQSQQSTKSNSTQQQSQLLDYSQLLYQQRNNPSSSMSTNNGYSHHSQSHHLHQRGNETNDMDEAATTSANSYSHTNGSPSNKNQSNNVNNNNNGYSQNNLMNSKEGSEYDNRQSLNNNNNTSSNNNNNYLSKYNSLRSSSKGLSLDSGSTPQPKFEVIKSSLSSQNQHQQAQQTNSSSQAHNQVSNLNNSQSNNTPHQQNGNQMSVKVNQSGQINLYSNKVKKSISTAGLTNNTTSSGSTTQTLETLRKQFANPNSFQSQQQSPVQQPMSSLPFQPLFNSQVSSTKSTFTPPQKMNQSNHYADIASQQQSQQQFQLSSSVDSSLMQAAVAAATNNSNNLRKTKEAMNFNYQNQLGLSHSQQFGVGGGHKKNAASLPGYSSLYNSTGFNSSALYSNNNNINENTNNTPQKSNLNTSNPQQQQQQQMLILQQQQQQQQQEQQQQQILISSFCVKSKPGSLPNKPIKTNQDSYIVFPSFCNNKNKFLFSVCDGHGSNGHLVSQFIKKKLPIHIEQCLKTKGNDFELQSVRQSLIQAYLKTADELKEQPLDTQLSGSTSVLLYINQKRIWCANLGDSRAICARTNKTEWTAISLSIDQKPDNEKERIRIVANGGRVEPYKDYYGNPLGPYRVWLSSENMPGLAMARSFGDQIAQSVGVISEPEVNCFEITDDDRFLVIASDGVWEFLSNEKVVSLVTPYYLKNDAEGACDRLIKESTAMWKKEDEVVDDITAIVVFLNKNPSGESSSKNSNLQDSVFLNTLKRSSLNMEHS